MKIVLKVFIFFITVNLFAQGTVEKTVGEFSELKVYDLIQVKLVKSDIDKVEIRGKNAKDVSIYNKNGTLKIKLDSKKMLDGKNTKVTLYYTKIDVIDVNEGATVNAIEEIKQFELDLKAQEGGEIYVKVNNTFTNARAITGGKIVVSGTTKKQKVRIITGGVYRANRLESETAEVNITAGTEAHIRASKLIEGNVKAGGKLVVYGKTEKIVHTEVLGSILEFVEQE